jgi:hypothetical protein
LQTSGSNAILLAIMILKPILIVGLATTTTASIEPTSLVAASKKYESCIFTAIDWQRETGHFSEKMVLSECASVRATQMKAAESAAARAGGAKNTRALIGREFSRLDVSVWTIVGHLRERRGNKLGGSYPPPIADVRPAAREQAP